MKKRTKLGQVIEIDNLVKRLKTKVFAESEIREEQADLNKIIIELTQIVNLEEEKNELYTQNQDRSGSGEW